LKDDPVLLTVVQRRDLVDSCRCLRQRDQSFQDDIEVGIATFDIVNVHSSNAKSQRHAKGSLGWLAGRRPTCPTDRPILALLARKTEMATIHAKIRTSARSVSFSRMHARRGGWERESRPHGRAFLEKKRRMCQNVGGVEVDEEEDRAEGVLGLRG
jgi:hypothetical protein